MPNGGAVRGATIGGDRPEFVDDLLALQGDVPAPAEAIGSSGDLGAGGGGVASTIGAAAGGMVLLLGALVALPALAAAKYLLN